MKCDRANQKSIRITAQTGSDGKISVFLIMVGHRSDGAGPQWLHGHIHECIVSVLIRSVLASFQGSPTEMLGMGTGNETRIYVGMSPTSGM